MGKIRRRMPPRTVHLPASTQRGCRNAGPSARTSRNTYKCSARGAPLCRQAPAARHLVGSASRRPMPINTDEAMARRSGRATLPPTSTTAFKLRGGSQKRRFANLRASQTRLASDAEKTASGLPLRSSGSTKIQRGHRIRVCEYGDPVLFG